MTVRCATPQDLSAIMSVYATARAFMKSNGNPAQWGDSYPSAELVASDIAEKRLHIIEDETDGCLLGIFAFFEDGEPLYNNIEGNWLNDHPYAAIHRVASSGARRGFFKECITYCLTRNNNLKIDTHSDNIPMQNALIKLGFKPCGTIYLENGEPRLAYQLALS